jgi:monoamine oxidase
VELGACADWAYDKAMPTTSCDVLIVGAGAAGLAAASELAHARCSALLLEARLHIGGRVWSHHEPGLPVPVELGAEFIHGRSRATFSLVGKAATAAVDSRGEHWTLAGGKLERAGELFSEIEQAVARTRALDKKDLPFASFLERHLDPVLSPEAAKFARTFAEGFDAADLERASARAIVEEWSGESVQAPQFRPLGGYGPLLSTLAGELRGSSVALQLNTVIRTLKWKPHAVQVKGTFLGRPFDARASRAIVTLPLGVLQLARSAAGAVRFIPSLTEKRAALKLLAPGPVVKVLLRFRTAFWEKLNNGRYCNAAFFHAREAPFPTFWTTLPIRTPLLVAWAAGPKADRLAGASTERLIGCALDSLKTLFGDGARVARKLEGAWVHDWQADPYACGAYSYVRVGGDHARKSLAQPLRDTLFFAGEAADTQGESGTVGGALQSGARAAGEVLRSLNRGKPRNR